MYIIYTTETCSFCLQAKALLKKNNLSFKEELLDSEIKIKDFKGRTGHKTVPQIYHNSKASFASFTSAASFTSGNLIHIGGYNELVKWLNK